MNDGYDKHLTPREIEDRMWGIIGAIALAVASWMLASVVIAAGGWGEVFK